MKKRNVLRSQSENEGKKRSSGTANVRIDNILRAFLNQGVQGIAWVDQSKDQFKIDWKHGGRKIWDVSDATVPMLYCKIKGLCDVNKDYMDYKEDFRAAMRTSKIRLVEDHHPPANSSEESYRIYQFTKPPHQPSINKCMEVLSSITGNSTSEKSARPIADGHAQCTTNDRSRISDNPELGCSTSSLNTTVLDFTNSFLFNLPTVHVVVPVMMPMLTTILPICQSDPCLNMMAMTRVAALDPSPHNSSAVSSSASPYCAQMPSTINEYVTMPMLTTVPSTCQSDPCLDTTTAMTCVAALDPSPHDSSAVSSSASPCCEQMPSTIDENVTMPMLTTVPSTCQSDPCLDTTTAMTCVAALDPSPHDSSAVSSSASPCCEQMPSTIDENVTMPMLTTVPSTCQSDPCLDTTMAMTRIGALDASPRNSSTVSLSASPCCEQMPFTIDEYDRLVMDVDQQLDQPNPGIGYPLSTPGRTSPRSNEFSGPVSQRILDMFADEYPM